MPPSPDQAMSTILSCTDGSSYAASVYDHTAWAALRTGAEVHVLHMLEHPPAPASFDLSGSIGLGARTELMEELVSQEEALSRIIQTRSRVILTQARQHLEQAGVARVKTEHQHGALVDAIELFEAQADLVVIGKRGEHADLAKLHLGSNLERVVRACHHPVLIASRAFQPIQTALIAYDGSPSMKKAIDEAVQGKLLQGLKLHLLTVGTPRPAVETELEAARLRLAEAGYAVTAEHASGAVETVIAEQVARQGVDLLITGAYGHSRIRHLIIGSTTSTLIRTVTKPVLIFR